LEQRATRLRFMEPAAKGKAPFDSIWVSNLFVFSFSSRHECVGVVGRRASSHSTAFREKRERFSRLAPARGWRVPCHREIGKMTRPTAALFVLVLSMAAVPAAGSPRATTAQDGVRFHVRTTDPHLRRLLQDGLETSPTFRALVDRLIGSDVIVYLECDNFPSSGVDGRLSFATSAGGYRYVLIRMRQTRSRQQQVALLAHELRHAVEVVDTPAIVDAGSMAREYGRMGYLTRWAQLPIAAFDTAAAVQAGYEVLRELTGEKMAPPSEHDSTRAQQRRRKREVALHTHALDDLGRR
jgi:hypothetical protein